MLGFCIDNSIFSDSEAKQCGLNGKEEHIKWKGGMYKSVLESLGEEKLAWEEEMGDLCGD